MVEPLFVVIFNLEVVQDLLLLLVSRFEQLVLALELADVLKQRLVSLLSRQELLDHFLHVRVASTGPHKLEGLLSVRVLLHLALHALLKVARPDLLDVELLLHLLLLLVLALVLGLLPNQVLVQLAFVALLNCVLLVLD